MKMNVHLPRSLASNLVPILSIGIIAGAAAWSVIAPSPATPELNTSLGVKTTVEGIVVRDPDIREKTVRLTIRPDRVGSAMIYHNTRVIVSADKFITVSYGDRVAATGVISLPESFETASGRTFDYQKYLLAHGITHEISFAQVHVLSHSKGNPVVSILLSVKHILTKGINRALPEPESALLLGLLLGDKQSLGDAINEAFRKAGVVHIIVLSGYNVALVITAVTFIALRIFSRGVAYGVAAFFVIAFAIMTGGSETTIRATIMALLMMLAAVLHRPAAALRGLLIAAAVMALLNPLIVLYDLSFQLSVLATLGLILFSGRIAKRLSFIPESLGLREIVSTTLATQVTVLPLLIVSVGAVSVVFLPANVLILPAVPLAMLFGFIAALLALVSYALAFPVSLLAYGILASIVNIAVWFGSLPFSSLNIPPDFQWVALGVLSVLYATAFWLIRRGTVFQSQRRSGF